MLAARIIAAVSRDLVLIAVVPIQHCGLHPVLVLLLLVDGRGSVVIAVVAVQVLRVDDHRGARRRRARLLRIRGAHMSGGITASNHGH